MLEVVGVSKSFGTGSSRYPVLVDVSLTAPEGASVGLVGESGSGKSTLIRCALGLHKPDAGTVRFEGRSLDSFGRAERLRFRRKVQLVFQDPFGSLNPRMTVEELITEGLVIHGLEKSAAVRRDRAAELLTMVGLTTEALPLHASSFSGGQRQRIAIARALAVRPSILICDEPVSALDVSVQAQVINLLSEMKNTLGLGILFVAHDLAVVRHLCQEIAVLEKGRIVERGSRAEVFGAPSHPYTRSLMEAVPVANPAVARERRHQRLTASAVR